MGLCPWISLGSSRLTKTWTSRHKNPATPLCVLKRKINALAGNRNGEESITKKRIIRRKTAGTKTSFKLDSTQSAQTSANASTLNQKWSGIRIQIFGLIRIRIRMPAGSLPKWCAFIITSTSVISPSVVKKRESRTKMASYLHTWRWSRDIVLRASCDIRSISGCPMTSSCPEVGHFRRNDLNWQVHRDVLNIIPNKTRGYA